MLFLQEISEKIKSENLQSFDDIIIIIPNKRAATYIYNYLANSLNQPFFPPKIITINEWIKENTSTTIINSSELLFVFYSLYNNHNEKPETFEQFSKWAKTLLSDFDEIDRYLIEADEIFSDLTNIKEIENWSFNDETLSEGQENFHFFWKKLPNYYHLLNAHLEKINCTYAGKAYKDFALSINKHESNYRHFYFIGFNALSASEEKIISYLIKYKKGTFITEIDNFYYKNQEHEAGYFFKQYEQKWNYKPVLTNHFDEIQKNIKIIDCAYPSAQANIATKIIQDILKNSGDCKNTAIVLADESLLIPVLQNIPEKVGDVNITMGYPLKYAHLKSLVDLIFELQFNFLKFKHGKLYYKTILNVLDQNYISSLIENKSQIAEFEDYIIKHNKVFIDWSELSTHFHELSELKDVFSYWENISNDCIKAMNKLINSLQVKFAQSGNFAMELEVLFHFARACKKLETLIQKYQVEIELKSFKKLFYQFWQNETLSFLGNPIDGLQVMGILETRTIDFKNIILLGVNEGNLPQANQTNSFIPYDLRKYRGLPTEEDRQAIYANHFYRLLHRAENIFITYNSGGDENGFSEKSRYITQLENEIDKDAHHKISYETYSPGTGNSIVNEISYPFNDSIKSQLLKYFENGLSPSALNKLVNCSQDFFYRYIFEMEETSELEENVESSTFGTKIHKVLEHIFSKHFLNKKPLDAKILAEEKKHLAFYLNEAYTNIAFYDEDERKKNPTIFTQKEMQFGQNKLSFDISVDFLNKFIEKQIDEIKNTPEPIEIIYLEKEFKSELIIEINNQKFTINLKGNIDRVDKIGNGFRIIDYKSGKCSTDKVKINSDALISDDGIIVANDKSYVRQLLMYGLLFEKEFKNYPVSVGIISMVNINQWLQNVDTTKNSHDLAAMISTFENQLKLFIGKLFEDDFVFKHNPASRYCEHCNN